MDGELEFAGEEGVHLGGVGVGDVRNGVRVGILLVLRVFKIGDVRISDSCKANGKIGRFMN